MAEAVGSARTSRPKKTPRFTAAPVPGRHKKTPRFTAAFFLSSEPNRLLRHGLLEGAIDLLVGRVATGLAGLCGLQRLVRSALRAVGSRACRSGGAGSRVRCGLRCCGVLHCLVSSGLDLIDRLLRDAAAGSDEYQGSDACLQRSGDAFLHDFFPLLLGRTKMDRSD